jgi:WD40 repeat protein
MNVRFAFFVLGITLAATSVADAQEEPRIEFVPQLGHSSPVNSVAFAPDGKTALSGSSDGTVRVWDLRRGELMVTLLDSRDGDQLAITPAGFYAASGKGVDKMLHVVRGFETYSILQFQEHLNRPDLVAERLKGDPDSKYRNAASELNLDKILQPGKAEAPAAK